MEQATETPTNDIALEELLGIERTDLFPEESNEPPNSMTIARQVASIRKLEKQIEQYEQQQKEARSFYEQRVLKCEDRIGYLKRSILAYLQQNNLKNIQTPSGTAFQKQATVRHWPEDSVLLEWADKNLPDAVRIKREPEKKMIAEHVAKSGEAPEGYSETKEVRIHLR